METVIALQLGVTAYRDNNGAIHIQGIDDDGDPFSLTLDPVELDELESLRKGGGR